MGVTWRAQAGCEAALLLTEQIRELCAPDQLFRLAGRWEAEHRESSIFCDAVRRTAMVAAVLAIFRLREIKANFLTPWLFTESELVGLGFASPEAFVRDWEAFETIRHQWAGHATSREARGGQPGRMLEATALGRALARTGLSDPDAFLRTVKDALVPGVERTRDELLRRFPEAAEFIRRYPVDMEIGGSCQVE